MKLRKVMAAVAATAIAASAMAAAAYAEPAEKGVFIIGFADNDWKAAFWGKDGDALDSSYQTTAAYTGDGTYTVKVDLSSGYVAEGWVDEDTGEELTLTTANGVAAMGIQIYNGTEDQFANLGVNITSVKFDGVEMELKGVSFTNDEDNGRRTNIYNGWASYDPNKEDIITTDPDKATTVLIDPTKVGEWSVCEVTFEAYTVGGDAAEAPADEEVVVAPADETPVVDNTAAAGDVDAATDSSKGSPDTGVADVAAVAGLAIVAAGAVVISRKRK
ncbi:MAG: NPXTG-anchored protein [Ruminiclostridium sp.]